MRSIISIAVACALVGGLFWSYFGLLFGFCAGLAMGGFGSALVSVLSNRHG